MSNQESDAKGKNFIQQVRGNFIFLGRAVNSTLLYPISAIASKLANPTEGNMKQTQQLPDYIATQEEAVLIYNISNMKLAGPAILATSANEKQEAKQEAISSYQATP